MIRGNMFRIFLVLLQQLNRYLVHLTKPIADDDDDAVSCACIQFVNRTLHIILCIYAYMSDIDRVRERERESCG